MLWPENPPLFFFWPQEPSGPRWNTERISQVLKQETAAGLSSSIRLHDYREIAISISRRYLLPKLSFKYDVDNKDGDFDKNVHRDAVIMVEQAAHSLFTADSRYARLVSELSGGTATKRERFRAASMDWHHLLGLGPPRKHGHPGASQGGSGGGFHQPPPGHMPRKRFQATDAISESKMLRWKKVRSINPESQLKVLYGP